MSMYAKLSIEETEQLVALVRKHTMQTVVSELAAIAQFRAKNSISSPTQAHWQEIADVLNKAERKIAF